jgi:hypothetical protein
MNTISLFINIQFETLKTYELKRKITEGVHTYLVSIL